jgi:prophage regulatory protein
MRVDMLERLRLDPGTRTLGELLQERQWAVHEIERLRSMPVQRPAAERVERAAPSATARPTHQQTTQPPSAPPIAPSRMLRLAEVQVMAGLSRSTIYQMIARGQFPAGTRVSERARRWRFGEITAWQDGLAPGASSSGRRG